MNLLKTSSKYKCFILVLALCIQAVFATAGDIHLRGTIEITDKYIMIEITNISQQSIFIKDFWHSFSIGEFVRAGEDSKMGRLRKSDLIAPEEPIYSRGRQWINIPANSEDTDYPTIRNRVRLRISLSELQEKSLLSANSGDRVDFDIWCANRGIKTPVAQDWKQYRLSLKFTARGIAPPAKDGLSPDKSDVSPTPQVEK